MFYLIVKSTRATAQTGAPGKITANPKEKATVRRL